VSTTSDLPADLEPQPARHLGAGAALSVAADIGTLIAAAAVSVVLARAIGPSANGTYALLATMLNIAILVVSLGVSAGITYQVSHGNWPVRRAFPTTFRAALLLGLIGTAASLGFYALTRHTVMRSVQPHLAVVAVAAIPTAVVWQFATAILLGRERYEGYAGVQLTNAALILLASAGGALVFGLTGAVAGMTASSVLTAVAATWVLRRWVRKRGDVPPASEVDTGARHLRRAFRFGLQSWLGNILQQANYRLDLLVLGGFAAASHVGLYSVAVTITEIGWILPHGLQTVLFPRAASLHAASDVGAVTAEESDAAVARVTRHSVLMMLPAGLIVAILLAAVPLVYGGKFDETVALGFVLLPGVLILGVGKVLGSVVAGRGRPRYMLYSAIITAPVTIALYFALIPSFHEWGASAASTISYALTTIVVLVYFRKATHMALRSALIPTRADVRNYLEAVSALRVHLSSRRAHRPVL
jgi:O-antigen/teichoic acid export membrane protein